MVIEEIIIDDFTLGFRCLTKHDFEIEIIGQDTIITEVGIPFYMSVDKLELGLISSEFPEEVFPVVDPYAMPGYPKVNIYEAAGFENSNSIITPLAGDTNPILMPVDVEIGTKQSGTYEFKIYIHEIPGSSNNPLAMPGLNVYPNPFEHGFHIENTEQVKKLNVFSLSGILIISMEDVDGFVNMSAYQSGVYLIEIQFNNGERQYLKLIKK